MDPQPTSLPSRLLLGVVVLLGYMAIANTVQQLYPFSVFDMYAHRATSASRIGARTADGQLSEVTAWSDWRCDGPIRVDAPQAPGAPTPYGIPYRDREAEEWLLHHQGAGGQAVDVVRHIWWLEAAEGQPEIADRVLLHCQAVRQ